MSLDVFGVQCDDFFVFSTLLKLSLCSTHSVHPPIMAYIPTLAALMDDDCGQAEKEDGRLACDPSVSVGDLETALTKYFDWVGSRDLTKVRQVITVAKCSWTTAPKARA